MNIRKPLLFINILLAGLIVWVAVNVLMTRALSEERKSPLQRVNASENQASGKQASPGAESQRVYYTIARHDIFGTTRNPRKEPVPTPVKISGLRLKLKGTVLGKNQESYAVVLNERTREQGLYRVNDVVQGARIARILADQVILKVGDGEEALFIAYESTPGPKVGKKIIRKVNKGYFKPIKKPPIEIETEKKETELNDDKDENKGSE